MDLTKEALQYLAEQVIKPEERVISINNQSYVIDENGYPKYVAPKLHLAQNVLRINTLSGLVDYIKSNLDRADEKLYLHIANHKSVRLVSTLKPDGSREELAIAEAILPKFCFNIFYDAEDFNVALQSMFIKNPDCEILLKVVGNLKEGNVKVTGDDGVSQAVTIKTGVASAADVKVPNPVTLAPYRTFIEVEQPESKFIFRMQDGPKGAIFEADGGAWRNQAILNIKKYLGEQLSDEIRKGKITILA
ncbi:hypothetical protein B6U46_05740 [Ligilactobacillus salivarius]|uniref:hypothetical protein n=1 Tax=Ligilactobacillus salivarius TaxID=1624 RepID=UPI0009F0BF09|nr:hypothetical protein [Ligilactobacillus salivarius]OQR07566.1 hypothetical protein B6U46_05740 [Ligilactobacillus salivarius]